MAEPPSIYTIQASDAPQHSETLRKILSELEAEKRISGFTVLTSDDDLSLVSNNLQSGDLVIILLTSAFDTDKTKIENQLKTITSVQPGVKVAEIIINNVVYDNEFITFPADLRPIRDRSDMDEAWNNIARILRDMFPVKKKKKAKLIPLWILFLVLGVFLTGALLIYLSSTVSDVEKEKTLMRVPDVTGMSGTEAVSNLLDAGLEVGDRRVEFHDTVENDLVIRSNPNSGESIEKGAQVHLVTSGGREQVQVPEQEEPEEDFFIVVEDMPELIGGLASIQQNIRYPEMAQRAGIEGRVYVQFIVNEHGEVEDPRVIRGIGGGCDEEAIRVVRSAQFRPGMHRGRSVRVQYSMPIVFRIRN